MSSLSASATASEATPPRGPAVARRRRAAAAAAALLLALGACSDGAPPEEGAEAFETSEHMRGSTLEVTMITESAPYEDAFVDYVVARFPRDVEEHPSFSEYSFRLSLIPEDAPEAKPVSVLFSYMFFDREAVPTSHVEAFEFLLPRAVAREIADAPTEADRLRFYEDVRERQPELNPDFARRRDPGSSGRSAPLRFAPQGL